jgi:hypothetical protein
MIENGEKGRIEFDEESKRYQFITDSGQTYSLSCGAYLEVWDGEEWLYGHVEYNRNWHRGYYFVVVRDDRTTGTVPLWDKRIARYKDREQYTGNKADIWET